MNDKSIIPLLSFQSKINHKGEIAIPAEELKKLYSKGYSHIKVELFGSYLNACDEKGIDKIFFAQVKSIQSLPEKVVFDFLQTKGTMQSAVFSELLHGEK